MAYRNYAFDTAREKTWAAEVAGSRESPEGGREAVVRVEEEKGGGEGGEPDWVTDIRASPDGGREEEVVRVEEGRRAGQEERVVVLGTGDFGRALAGRLARAGLWVSLASRDPARAGPACPEGVPVAGLASLQAATVVVVAVPRDFYHTLPADLLADKILIDVSNRPTVRRTAGSPSQAEQLAGLFPSARVVKALNVVSAYSLERGEAGQQVPLAGEGREARERVAALLSLAGFLPRDRGGLQAAAEIEDIPMAVFPAWRAPLIIHLLLFTLLYILSFAKFQICWPLTWSDDWSWELWHHIPMDNMNKTLAVHALASLALCYLPGVLAAWLQLYRGTKYSAFPRWLDRWLRMRKQLGLLMLLAASVHACLSLAYMSPSYQGIVFGEPVEVFAQVMEGEGWGPKVPSANKTSVKVYGGTKLDWRGECFLMAGVLGFGLVCLLGLSSLPSVAASLSWREFTFIQSGLGWAALVLLCAHDMFYGWPYMDSPSCSIPSSFQYALYLPGLAILLKLPLLLPPFSTHLSRLRTGYVRSGSDPGKV